MERRERLRRDGDDYPAADRAALRQQIGARTDSGIVRQPQQASYEIVRDFWVERRGAKAQPTPTPPPIPAQARNEQEAAQVIMQLQAKPRPTAFDQWWQEVLRTGVAPDTASEPKQVSAKTDWLRQNTATAIRLHPIRPAIRTRSKSSLRPDPSIYDGRFAHNGWLQELPKPLTKLAWGNAIEISPATAERFGLNTEIAWRGGEHGQALVDVVELQYRGRKLAAPVWITLGHADGCATVHLGYGRARGGVGAGVGFNAYAIRTSDAPWFARGLTIRKTGERQPVATTQLHYTMQGRAGAFGHARRIPPTS